MAKTLQIVTFGTHEWSQNQPAMESVTAQSNVSKLLKKHRITGEV